MLQALYQFEEDRTVAWKGLVAQLLFYLKILSWIWGLFPANFKSRQHKKHAWDLEGGDH